MSTTETRVGIQGREALSRAVRQVIQALIPTMLVIAGGSTTGLDVPAIATLAGLTGLISVMKSAANVRVDPDGPRWAQIAERAVTAAAGTALSLVTVDGVVPQTEIHWQATLTAAIGSAVLAVAMFYSNPPAVPADVVDGEIVESVAPRPETTYLGDDVADPFPPPRDGGNAEVLVALGVATLIGVVLLLFGVSFK